MKVEWLRVRAGLFNLEGDDQNNATPKTACKHQAYIESRIAFSGSWKRVKFAS